MIGRNCIARYGILCGPLKIPVGPVVAHMGHVENRWFR